jgi:Transglycosylase SLT domain
MKMRKTLLSIWATIATLLFVTSAQPTAYGLEFPMTTRLVLPDAPAGTGLLVVSPSSAKAVSASLTSAFDSRRTVFSNEIALVSAMSRSVEAARKPLGAKRFAKEMMATEYGWGEGQYKCLNRLWTKESNWNYQARNPRSGAHGIAQALPASKMEKVGTDWRTNPITQIQWGLLYVSERYDTPCAAWNKFRRSNFY